MNIFKKLPKKLLVVLATVAAMAGLTSVALANFGPDRPVKAYYDGVAGFDYPVFDSLTNVPGYGDERNFLTGAYPGGGSLTDPLAEVKQNDELTLQILVHNNADPKYNADGSGFAKDTKVRIALPTGLAKSQQATAYITASNTTPTQIFDTLDFGSYNGGYFQLEYVPGSAHVRGNYIDTALSDDIVGNGATVGTHALDGTVEGCFKEEVLVTLKVRVKMPHYTLKKEVRLDTEPTNTYATSKSATLSDTLVWKMTFTNIGETKLSAVQFVDPLPANMSVIPGTIKVYNSANPNGYVLPDTAIRQNGRQVEMILGDYAPDGNAFIYFKTKTDHNTGDLCGVVNEKNVAYVQPQGLIAISNEATVAINTGKTCTEPTTPVFTCDGVTIAKIGDRKVRATVATTATPANRVQVKSYEYNFGDGSTPLVSNSTPAEYAYTKDGTYNVSVKVTFSVDGVNQTVSGASCAKAVTFTHELPNTGSGNMLGLFVLTTLVGMFGFRAYAIRKG